MTVRAEWNVYDREVLSSAGDVSETQRTKTRRAFYAGAAVMMRLVVKATRSDDEEKGMAELDALEGELRRFSAKVGTPEEGQ